VAAWTRLVLRHRVAVLAVWIAALLAGGFASTKLSPLLSNTFRVPGTDSERVRIALERQFGDRPDGSFTAVFQLARPLTPAGLARLQQTVDRAARVLPSGRPTALIAAGPKVVFGDIVSTLSVADAKGYTDELRAALGTPAGVAHAYVTGAGPIQHDLDPIFSEDLKKGEGIAIPIAILILLGVFGISLAVTIPFIFAACTIMGSLGILYGVAHLAETPTYTTNLIQLIGLGISVDYSLLVVYRFREELARGLSKDDAVVRTMETAGRAVIFSGAAVALGLALLLAMPLPFMRMMGVAGFLIPCISILAAATLQPALLSFYGRRGTARRRILPGEPTNPEQGAWARLARSIMARPLLYLAGGTAVLVAAAVPAFSLHLTPGSTFGIPRSPQAIRGFDVLQAAVGPGAVAPAQVLVHVPSGSVHDPPVQAALARLVTAVRADPEVAAVYTGSQGRYVDPSGRYEQLILAGRHDYGFPEAQAFVRRLRGQLIPAARFPAAAEVRVGGAPGQGVDFLHEAYTYFPPLIAAVLVLTYLLLMRAFRSVLLPLKAILLNLLSVGAAYGMLVVFFRWGVGSSLFGLYQFGQVEGWIPIFLFAMLFGLSMDYEVFLVTRMRESWDHGADNVTAVAHGLERTGRIITAAAIIMCAAFSGFVAGRIVGLQEFGLGLAVAIFVDATIVRSLLVPSLMAILGRWNWWLPRPFARMVRVPPSPLADPGA
jgi:RND superfamily putative drug exporter